MTDGLTALDVLNRHRVLTAMDVLGMDDWNEGDHPRGQPGNAGQFGSGGGGTKKKTPKKAAAATAEPTAPKPRAAKKKAAAKAAEAPKEPEAKPTEKTPAAKPEAPKPAAKTATQKLGKQQRASLAKIASEFNINPEALGRAVGAVLTVGREDVDPHIGEVVGGAKAKGGEKPKEAKGSKESPKKPDATKPSIQSRRLDAERAHEQADAAMEAWRKKRDIAEEKPTAKNKAAAQKAQEVAAMATAKAREMTDALAREQRAENTARSKAANVPVGEKTETKPVSAAAQAIARMRGSSNAAARQQRRTGESTPTHQPKPAAPARAGAEQAASIPSGPSSPAKIASGTGRPKAPPTGTAKARHSNLLRAENELDTAGRLYHENPTPFTRAQLTAARAKLNKAQEQTGVPEGKRVKVDSKPKRRGKAAMDVLAGDERPKKAAHKGIPKTVTKRKA